MNTDWIKVSSKILLDPKNTNKILSEYLNFNYDRKSSDIGKCRNIHIPALEHWIISKGFFWNKNQQLDHLSCKCEISCISNRMNLTEKYLFCNSISQK